MITKPGAPLLTEVGADDRFVMALWAPSDDTGGADPTEFTVELDGPTGVQTVTTAWPYIEFTGLTNGASYRLRVAATNSAGTGDFSAWSDELIPLGPAAAPVNVIGTAYDGGVELGWSAPDDTGGAPLESYAVEMTSQGVVVELESPEPALRLATLANGVAYTFRIAAITAAGTGAWSAPLVLTPRADPVTAPENVSATKRRLQIMVTWSAPQIGDPVRYVVAASTNGGPWRVKKSVATTSTSFAITKRTTEVSVRVLAIDSYGRGPWSDSTGVAFQRQR